MAAQRPIKPDLKPGFFQTMMNGLWQILVEASNVADKLVDFLFSGFENLFLRIFDRRAYKEKLLSQKVQALEKHVRQKPAEEKKRHSSIEIESPPTQEEGLTAKSEKIKHLMSTAEKIRHAQGRLTESAQQGGDLKGRHVSIHHYSTLSGALRIFEESRRTVLSETLREQLQLLRDAQREVAELNDAVERAILKLEEIDVADITDMDDLRLSMVARLKVVFEEVQRRAHIVDAALADFKSLQALMFTERETLNENMHLLEESMAPLL